MIKQAAGNEQLWVESEGIPGRFFRASCWPWREAPAAACSPTPNLRRALTASPAWHPQLRIPWVTAVAFTDTLRTLTPLHCTTYTALKHQHLKNRSIHNAARPQNLMIVYWPTCENLIESQETPKSFLQTDLSDRSNIYYSIRIIYIEVSSIMYIKISRNFTQFNIN